MAEVRTAWGIDIGQAGLKAIKLRAEGDGVRAVAFDYIAHPKILSQPDAIPEELISQAVDTFLSRNKVGKDLIGLSVGGQSSLAKFIKLPPVEPSKVAEIVKYEAKQQIPFDLDDVCWDYQTIGGGVEESGFMLEAEVGLFAMKRDLVYQAMQPLTSHKTEVELVQVAPLGLYNYLSYDVLGFRTDAADEPDDAEDYYILLDKGCDNTTLLVSNGRNIWIRNVPIGGNHFTRALTREMKLTFAKAEHLKCNATKAPDPKAVFKAMRPVFNEYVTEIQRSIGFFGSVNRAAKIKRIIGVGNGFRMAGLQKFLQQNLQVEVKKLDQLKGVSGDGVLSDPLFIDNMMAFAVPYGIALQTLKQTRIKTTLLPPEIVTDRAIRAKKPWAAGIAAGLLATMGAATFANAHVLKSYDTREGGRYETAVKEVASLEQTVSSNQSKYDAQRQRHTDNVKRIEELTAPLTKREMWLELLKAVNECLPRDTGNALDETDITLQKQLRIKSFTHKRVEDVAAWHKALVEGGKEEDFLAGDTETPPEAKEGYIVTLRGYHFFNNDSKINFRELGINFVKKTLCESLRQWNKTDSDGRIIPIAQMGITHPLVVDCVERPIMYDPDARIGASSGGAPGMGMGQPGMGMGGPGMGMGEPGMGMGEPGMGGPGMGMGEPGMGMGEPGGGGFGTPQAQGNSIPVDSIDETKTRVRKIDRSDFVVQFAWIPISESDRKETPDESPSTDTAN